LKPSNVLLQISDCRFQIEEGKSAIFNLQSAIPKITDFGLAKVLDGEANLVQTETFIGTASYVAPEQAAGRASEVGPPADVYSVGAILYELLTGRPPFQANTVLGIL